MRNVRVPRLELLGFALSVLFAASVHAADKKPNILIIWGDDIGFWNVSAYNQGMMGYKTLNIDRIAFKEFPPSQKVGSFSLDQAMEKLQTVPPGSN